jgi:parvulin-like peptidyl-prolyl isomerase
MSAQQMKSMAFAMLALCQFCAFHQIYADTAQATMQKNNNQVEVQGSQEKPERVVMARVGGTEITVEDFINFVSLNPERVRAARGTIGKSEILKIMIANLLLQKALEREGLLPENPTPEDFQKAMQKLANKHFPEPQNIDDEVMVAFYEANKGEFGIPESYRISQIQFKVPENADESVKNEIRKRAESALNRLNSGEGFADLANELTENTSAKEDRGDLGFVERGQWSPWLKKALDGLEIGQNTAVVESPVGYEILMITDRRSAITSTYPEVKMRIEDHLKKEAQQKLQNAYVKKLARDIEIEITLDELKDVNPDGMFP